MLFGVCGELVSDFGGGLVIYVCSGIDTDIGDGFGIGDGEEVDLEFEDEVDSEDVRSVNRGVKYVVSVKIGYSVDLYVDISVGAVVGRDVGGEFRNWWW